MKSQSLRMQIPLAIAFLGFAAASLAQDSSKTYSPKTTVAQRWEYVSTPICRKDGVSPAEHEKTFHSKLDELGRKGFELVSIFPHKFEQQTADRRDCLFAVFKRPVQQ